MIYRPHDCGIDTPAFQEFRPIQYQVFDYCAIHTTTRFLGLASPTGSGKSGIAIKLAREEVMRGGIAVIITGTKGLQDQYQREWGVMHDDKNNLTMMGLPLYQPHGQPIVWDVRGRRNYTCADYPDKTCQEGQHLLCSQHEKCTYKRNLYEAQLFSNGIRRIPITNYAMWLEIHRSAIFGEFPWHRPTLLILDEAHLAPDHLIRFLTLRLYESDFKMVTKQVRPNTLDPLLWRAYAISVKAEVDAVLKYLKSHITANSVDMLIRAREVADKLSLLRTLNNDWVIESKAGPRGGVYWEFAPVWVGRYAERYLFCNAKKVVLLSGTIRQKTMYQLGIDRIVSAYKEWPRVFPAYRSPVYHIKTVKLNKDSTDGDMWRIVHRIDEIFESRFARKGIIHTQSYARQDFILKNSKYAEYMLANTKDPDSLDAQAVVQKFKLSIAPSVLVTPSCGTGWDFPMEDAEWQVIVKVPYPGDFASKVMQHRMKLDRAYMPYLTSQELLQMCGRLTRDYMDRGETFILDGAISMLEYWMMPRGKLNSWLVPKWFKIWHVDSLPPLPPSLYQERRKGLI